MGEAVVGVGISLVGGTQGTWLEEEEFGLDILYFRYPRVFQVQMLRAGGCTLGAW